MVGRKNSLLQKTLVYFQWHPDGNLSLARPMTPTVRCITIQLREFQRWATFWANVLCTLFFQYFGPKVL